MYPFPLPRKSLDISGDTADAVYLKKGIIPSTKTMNIGWIISFLFNYQAACIIVTVRIGRVIGCLSWRIVSALF
jgi:hypothetical protein